MALSQQAIYQLNVSKQILHKLEWRAQMDCWVASFNFIIKSLTLLYKNFIFIYYILLCSFNPD